MRYKHIRNILLLVTIFLAGCQNIEKDLEPTEDEAPVVFGGSLNEIQNSNTRSRTMVTNRQFNVTFRKDEGYEQGVVDFNASGIGYSKRMETGSEIDLLWSYVSPDENNGERYSFYLDNLPTAYNQNSTTVIFPLENLYQVSEYVPLEKADPEKGIFSNDLYWGSVENVLREAVEEIDLYPVMARFCLKVYFDNSAVGEEFFPASATISNIYKSPKTFDKLTGTFGFRYPDEEETLRPDDTPFTLVEDAESWELFHDEETGMEYYMSPDFIIAPQEFARDLRPRLSVKLTNNVVYSGLFPLAMYLSDGNGGLTSWVMSFLKGYKLTLSVKIGNEAGSLQFMPVTMLEWWDKGQKNFTGYQASVSKDEELRELIEAYNEGREDEFYKWGYKDSTTGIWIFNIFKSFDFKASDFRGAMEEKSNLPYQFDLHYALVTVVLPGNDESTLTGVEGGTKLKELLNNGILPDPDPEISDESSSSAG